MKNKFKVGDKVRIKYTNSPDNDIRKCMGEIAIITEYVRNGQYRIDIGGENWRWYSDHWFESYNQWEAICI